MNASYWYHLKQEGHHPIPLERWEDAVAETPGLVLRGAAPAAFPPSPSTSPASSEFDALVLAPGTATPCGVLHWNASLGCIDFQPQRLAPGDPVWDAAFEIAPDLAALVLGDEHEIYDFEGVQFEPYRSMIKVEVKILE